MALNLSLEDLIEESTKLAGELELDISLENPEKRFTVTFTSHPEEKLHLYFCLMFKDLNSTSPQSVMIDVRYGQYIGKTDLYTTPAAITTFAHMEAILRDLCTLKEEVAKIKPRKAPKGKLVLTYDQINDWLYSTLDRNNDMHADGDGHMVLTTYTAFVVGMFAFVILASLIISISGFALGNIIMGFVGLVLFISPFAVIAFASKITRS